jgi:hypothetical protein
MTLEEFDELRQSVYEDITAIGMSINTCQESKSLIAMLVGQCPWCGGYLPTCPSNTLIEMMNELAGESTVTAGPRRSLSVNCTSLEPVCERHKYEFFTIDGLDELGWPRSIDFASVPARIKSPRVLEHLMGIMRYPKTSHIFLDWASVELQMRDKAVSDDDLQKSILHYMSPG